MSSMLKKILKKNNVIKISYTENGNDYNVRTTEQPKESFENALAKLKNIMLLNLQIPLPEKAAKDYETVAYREVREGTARHERSEMVRCFSVIGLAHSYNEKKGDCFKVFGMLGPNVIKTDTLLMPEEGDNFWTNHKKEDYPTFLTPEELKDLHTFINEAEAFIDGAREQMELFNADGEPTEEAEASQETEEF